MLLRQFSIRPPGEARWTFSLVDALLFILFPRRDATTQTVEDSVSQIARTCLWTLWLHFVVFCSRVDMEP